MADEEVVYVVQRRAKGIGALCSWDDVAKISVPPRTYTKTIVLRAVVAADLEDIVPSDRFRVLDVDAHTEYALREKERAPEYEVLKLHDGELGEVME